MNSNPYPVFGTEIEDQIYPTEDSIKSEPSHHLKHFYAEVGVNLVTISESAVGELSSLHTETSESLNPSNSISDQSKSNNSK